jgi:hypothetical protein
VAVKTLYRRSLVFFPNQKAPLSSILFAIHPVSEMHMLRIRIPVRAILILKMIFILSGSTSIGDNTPSDRRSIYGQQTDQRLSVTKGVVYTFVPGLVVHGSGSIYAGAPDLGAALIVAEAAGALMIFIGEHSKPDENTYPFERSSAQSDALIGGGVFLFAGSWLADLICTPVLIKKHNSKLERAKITFDVRESSFRSGNFTFGLACRF